MGLEADVPRLIHYPYSAQYYVEMLMALNSSSGGVKR
jgi:hypothetical protein